VRVIFNTFYRGSVDIMWFIVVSFVILSGYVFAGWQVFGQSLEGLKSYPDGYRYVFDMFLGHFDYTKISQLEPLVGAVFFFSYMIIFKFFVINMFLAIVCMNFEAEEKRRAEAVKKLALNSNKEPQSQQPTNFVSRLLGKVFGSSTPMSPNGGSSSDNLGGIGPGDLQAEFGAAGSASILTLGSNDAEFNNPRSDAIAESIETISEEAMKQLAAESPWHTLPEEMKVWSIDTAKKISLFVDTKVEARQVIKKNKTEATELDRCLEEAESQIKKNRQESRATALQGKQELERDELSRLREVHQDQESLSWYLMKREAELRKLEQTKEMKQKNYDQMVSAAKSLISSEDLGENGNGPVTGAGAALSLTNIPEESGARSGMDSNLPALTDGQRLGSRV